jgi:hypothetical protein
LWADSDRVSAPRARKSIGILPAACTPSTCSHPPQAATKAVASAMGWMTPVSLLASIRATNGRPSAGVQRPSRAASQPRSETPFESTGRTSTSTAEARAVAATVSCSMALTISRRAPAATALSSAVAFASAPPEVKTTEDDGAPTSAAT